MLEQICALDPTATPSPITVGLYDEVMHARSWMLVLLPIRIDAAVALREAPYQIEESDAQETSPTMQLFGATKAAASVVGVLFSNLTLTVERFNSST